MPGRYRVSRWVVVTAAVAVFAAVAVSAALATERPGFCRTCHEMRPYHDAWSRGRHASSATCVDCHIDRGVVAHLAHKPSELVEVYDHFFSRVRFPSYRLTIPDARCRRCHARVDPKRAAVRFSHTLHETKGRCISCHLATGHEVSLDALRAAGVMASGATAAPVPGGVTASSAPGHIRVSCQRCHDQAHMRCSACHEAPHDPRGDCADCHRPGRRFAFVHPAAGQRGCTDCHVRPKGHFAGACSTCHAIGPRFAFTHPPQKAGTCTRCHARPANHFPGECTACHSTSVPFTRARFDHPANPGEHSWRSFACVRCHPRGYGSASCTCHGGQPPSGD